MQKDKDMNMTQLRVVLQYIATAGASYIAGKGWLPQDVATQLMMALAVSIPAAISVYMSRDQGKVAAAANVEGVKIVAPEPIASAIPASNVVSSETHSVENKGVNGQ